MDTNRYRQKMDPDHCSNCGKTIRTQGPRPRSGHRFCMDKDCRAAKAREYYQSSRVTEEREPPTQCSCCGVALPSRPWRSGDDSGRWCKKTRCRSHRDDTRASLGSGGLAEALLRIEILETEAKMMGDAIMASAEEYIHAERVVCSECGLTTAIQEWLHQDREGKACGGTLNGVERRKVTWMAMSNCWPFAREYLDEEKLAIMRHEVE